MPNHDLTPYLEWFHSYIDGYITGERRRDSGILLKKEHSIEVLANARLILDSLEWDEGLNLIAEAAALLHDVGRFPQFARFRTFRDDMSGNHARLGVEVLARNPLLRELPGRGRKLVLGSVFLHNKAKTPDGLPRDLEMVTRLVRDADKIDIMRVVAGEVTGRGEHVQAVLLNLADSRDRYSLDVFERVRGRLPVDYRSLRYVNDFVLSVCGWVHDMNFPAAFRRLLETGHLQDLFSVLPVDDRIMGLRDDLMSRVRDQASRC